MYCTCTSSRCTAHAEHQPTVPSRTISPRSVELHHCQCTYIHAPVVGSSDARLCRVLVWVAADALCPKADVCVSVSARPRVARVAHLAPSPLLLPPGHLSLAAFVPTRALLMCTSRVPRWTAQTVLQASASKCYQVLPTPGKSFSHRQLPPCSLLLSSLAAASSPCSATRHPRSFISSLGTATPSASDATPTFHRHGRSKTEPGMLLYLHSAHYT